MLGAAERVRPDAPAATLSVALCTYNGARYLAEQLASIAGQTRRPDELVVCDDRSEDATADVVRAFAANAPFPVRFSVNAHNVGSTKNFEGAVARCTGDLIALADQDDVWQPGKLAALELALGAAADAAGVFSDARLVDEAGQPLGQTLWSAVDVGPDVRAALRGGRGLRVLMRKSAVTGATLVFRASYRPFLLPIAPEAVHDAWIALLLAAVAPIVSVAEPLVDYRQHGGNQIGAAAPTWRDRIRTVRRPRPMASVADFAAWLTAAHARLSVRGVVLLDPEALGLLGEHAAHLRGRASLPPRRFGRLRPVWREWRSGRYARFSNGLVSALKDVAS